MVKRRKSVKTITVQDVPMKKVVEKIIDSIKWYHLALESYLEGREPILFLDTNVEGDCRICLYVHHSNIVPLQRFVDKGDAEDVLEAVISELSKLADKGEDDETGH